MKKILNKLGLYTKSDLKKAFESGVMSEQGRMLIIDQSQFKFVMPKKTRKKGTA